MTDPPLLRRISKARAASQNRCQPGTETPPPIDSPDLTFLICLQSRGVQANKCVAALRGSTYSSIELDYRNRKGRLLGMWTPTGGNSLFPKKPITLPCFRRPGPSHPPWRRDERKCEPNMEIFPVDESVPSRWWLSSGPFGAPAIVDEFRFDPAGASRTKWVT